MKIEDRCYMFHYIVPINKRTFIRLQRDQLDRVCERESMRERENVRNDKFSWTKLIGVQSFALKIAAHATMYVLE